MSAVEEGVAATAGAPAVAVADVRLEALTKRFDEVVAVDSLDLEIPRGSFFALRMMTTADTQTTTSTQPSGIQMAGRPAPTERISPLITITTRMSE